MVGQAPLYQPFLPELPAQRGGHPAFLPLRVLSGWTDAPCSTAHPILQGGQTWFAVLPPAQTAWRFQPLRPASAVPENPVRHQHRQCGRQNCRWQCPDGRCCREGHRPAVPDNSARRGERFDAHSRNCQSECSAQSRDRCPAASYPHSASPCRRASAAHQLLFSHRTPCP